MHKVTRVTQRYYVAPAEKQQAGRHSQPTPTVNQNLGAPPLLIHTTGSLQTHGLGGVTSFHGQQLVVPETPALRGTSLLVILFLIMALICTW